MQQMQQQQPRNYQNKPPVKQNNFNNQQQPYNPQFPNQPPLIQQSTNNRNMKIFPVNQQPRRQRKKRIPAPAYVWFMIDYIEYNAVAAIFWPYVWVYLNMFNKHMLFGRIEYIGYNVITFVLQFFT